jgi:hypothetical protein
MKNILKCIGVILALWALCAAVWLGTNAGLVLADTPVVKEIRL